MCLTIPAKIKKLNNGQVEIDLRGRDRVVSNNLRLPLKVGDWVLCVNDYVFKKINNTEANELLMLLGTGPKTGSSLKINQTVLNKSDIISWLALEKREEIKALYDTAYNTKLSSLPEHICIHGIIEFSNYCINNCTYCGLRRDNKKVVRYRMSVAQIIQAAKTAMKKNYKVFVLQSGEDPYYDEEKLLQIISGIKKLGRVFIYLSIGDRDLKLYEKLFAAGARGVLMRFETSNKKLYATLHPGENFTNKLELIKKLKNIGYQISTGFMIGLPGQTTADIADDLLLLQELKPFMVSFGPFIPSNNTPLAKALLVDEEMILKTIAVARLLLPQAMIPITTAAETIAKGGANDIRRRAFAAGANAVMFNQTPKRFRDNYYIYENKFFDRQKSYERLGLFTGDFSYQMMEELGLEI